MKLSKSVRYTASLLTLALSLQMAAPVSAAEFFSGTQNQQPVTQDYNSGIPGQTTNYGSTAQLLFSSYAGVGCVGRIGCQQMGSFNGSIGGYQEAYLNSDNSLAFSVNLTANPSSGTAMNLTVAQIWSTFGNSKIRVMQIPDNVSVTADGSMSDYSWINTFQTAQQTMSIGLSDVTQSGNTFLLKFQVTNYTDPNGAKTDYKFPKAGRFYVESAIMSNNIKVGGGSKTIAVGPSDPNLPTAKTTTALMYWAQTGAAIPLPINASSLKLAAGATVQSITPRVLWSQFNGYPTLTPYNPITLASSGWTFVPNKDMIGKSVRVEWKITDSAGRIGTFYTDIIVNAGAPPAFTLETYSPYGEAGSPSSFIFQAPNIDRGVSKITVTGNVPPGMIAGQNIAANRLPNSVSFDWIPSTSDIGKTYDFSIVLTDISGVSVKRDISYTVYPTMIKPGTQVIATKGGPILAGASGSIIQVNTSTGIVYADIRVAGQTAPKDLFLRVTQDLTPEEASGYIYSAYNQTFQAAVSSKRKEIRMTPVLEGGVFKGLYTVSAGDFPTGDIVFEIAYRDPASTTYYEVTPFGGMSNIQILAGAMPYHYINATPVPVVLTPAASLTNIPAEVGEPSYITIAVGKQTDIIIPPAGAIDMGTDGSGLVHVYSYTQGSIGVKSLKFTVKNTQGKTTDVNCTVNVTAASAAPAGFAVVAQSYDIARTANGSIIVRSSKVMYREAPTVNGIDKMRSEFSVYMIDGLGQRVYDPGIPVFFDLDQAAGNLNKINWTLQASPIYEGGIFKGKYALNFDLPARLRGMYRFRAYSYIMGEDITLKSGTFRVRS